ncbi:MAG TPA: MFS transporter [Solirubrobacteraceae bacterium]|nr:MFS transporter [Solirubrobacteraceae bacterium]
MIRCLRIVAFRRLLTAYVFNELAWSVGTLALSLLVYKRTGSAIGSAGFFLCSQFLPALLSPALVARLDRASVRVVLPVLYAVEAVLFGVLAYLVHHFVLVPVLLLALADGAIAATARSLATAARIEILRPRDLLHEGNALGSFGFSGAFMLGPVIGGAVVAAGGTLAALLANCGLFAVVAVFLAITALPGSKAEPGSVWSRLGSGLAHVRSDSVMARLLIMQAVGLCIFTITIPVEVVYAQHTLHAGAGGYGLLLGVWGGGAVAGSVVFARFRRRAAPVLIAGSALALAAGFAVMTAAPSLIVALCGAAVAGAGNSVEWVAWRTAIQERTPDRWMALMMSLADSMSMLAPGLGIVAGGLITQFASSRAAFGVASGGSLLFAIVVPLAFRKAPSRRPERRGSVEVAAEEAAIPRGKSLV